MKLTVTLPKIPAALHRPHYAEGHHSHSHHEVRTAREAIKKLVGECSCLKWRMEIITKRFPNTASTAPKPNTVYRIRRGPSEQGVFTQDPFRRSQQSCTAATLGELLFMVLLSVACKHLEKFCPFSVTQNGEVFYFLWEKKDLVALITFVSYQTLSPSTVIYPYQSVNV